MAMARRPRKVTRQPRERFSSGSTRHAASMMTVITPAMVDMSASSVEISSQMVLGMTRKPQTSSIHEGIGGATVRNDRAFFPLRQASW